MRIFKRAVAMTAVAAAMLTVPVLAANPAAAAADGPYLPGSRCYINYSPVGQYPGRVDETGTYCVMDNPVLIPGYEYLGTSPECGTLVVELLTIIEVQCLYVGLPPDLGESTS